MGLVYQNSDKEQEQFTSKIEGRTGLVVWLNRTSDQYKLRHYGDIIYFSRKNKYVIIYVPKTESSAIVAELKAKDFVKKVDRSHHSQLDFSAEHEEKLMAEMKADAEKKLAEDGELPR